MTNKKMKALKEQLFDALLNGLTASATTYGPGYGLHVDTYVRPNVVVAPEQELEK